MSNPSMPYILISVLLSSFSASSAQAKPWQLILCSGDTLTACRLDSLHDDVLSGTCNIGTFSLPVDSIAALVQQKEGSFSKGAGTGSLVGAVAGVIIGGVIDHNSPLSEMGVVLFGRMFVGALAGLFVGGIIGTSSSGNETYELKGETLVVKLQIIERLLAQREDAEDEAPRFEQTSAK